MKHYLLGNMPVAAFLAAFFFALIGVTISLLLQANKRDPGASSTPYHFSYRFLLQDNWKRIVLSLLLIFVTIRFYSELTGKELSMYFALGIGLGLDKLAQVVKNASAVLQVNRKKL